MSLFLCFGFPFCTAVAEEAEAEVAERRESELSDIRQEIGRLTSRLEAVRDRELNLEEQLQRAVVELDLQQAQLKEAVAALELAEARGVAAGLKIAELEISLREIQTDLKQRLAGLYRLGRQGYLRLFLSLKPDQEILPAIRQLRFLARRDRMVLDRYSATRDELTRQRERLEAQRQQALEWKELETERRDGLVRLRRQRERLLSKVTRERRQLAARTQLLQEKERKLKRLIGSLEVDENVLAGRPIQDFRGVLDWPIRGEITAKFGPRRDPRYRTEVPHNGVDIAVVEGESVRVVFPGQVLYASQFEGYGTMVVVLHPGRVFSLYAGMVTLSVQKGDVLSLGDVLGTCSETLYFEVRVENLPENPLLWLR